MKSANSREKRKEKKRERQTELEPSEQVRKILMERGRGGKSRHGNKRTPGG